MCQGWNSLTGYGNKPAATADSFRGGWYHTGDASYLDDERYLFLVDRVQDRVVTGGENVYSVEVENAISTHPAVARVAVIGIPSERWGEAVHAIVILNHGAEANGEEVVLHGRESIAGYRVPQSVEFRTEALPLPGAIALRRYEGTEADIA